MPGNPKFINRNIFIISSLNTNEIIDYRHIQYYWLYYQYQYIIIFEKIKMNWVNKLNNFDENNIVCVGIDPSLKKLII